MSNGSDESAGAAAGIPAGNSSRRLEPVSAVHRESRESMLPVDIHFVPPHVRGYLPGCRSVGQRRPLLSCLPVILAAASRPNCDILALASAELKSSQACQTSLAGLCWRPCTSSQSQPLARHLLLRQQSMPAMTEVPTDIRLDQLVARMGAARSQGGLQPARVAAAAAQARELHPVRRP